MKRCGLCGIEKSLEMFSRNSNEADGHMRWCKKCWSSYRKNNRMRLASRKALRIERDLRRYVGEGSFAQAVRIGRKSCRLSQETMAKNLGVSVNTLQRVETGQGDISRRTALMIVRYLQLPTSTMGLP